MNIALQRPVRTASNRGQLLPVDVVEPHGFAFGKPLLP
jgi:hypothetical protein